jgi:hypothetical protein
MKGFSAVAWASAMTLCACVTTSHATPEITPGGGSFEAGASYEISGSGFGTKSTAAPVKFEDFEAGTPDHVLSGWAFSSNQFRHPVYSDTYTRPNSTRSGKCLFDNDQWLSSFGVQSATDITEAYIDFWYLYDPADPASRNHKLFRIYAEAAGGLPNLGYYVSCNPNSNDALAQSGVNTGNYMQWVDWGWGHADKQWVHFQGYFKASSTTVDDGEAHLWIDCSHRVNQPSFRTRTETNPMFWHSIWFGNFLAHDPLGSCTTSPGASFTYWDDVYVDFTRARVEIGNAATYNTCTHREIQVPTEWSDTAITITVNGGSYADGSNVYLYVVDSNGVVNEHGALVVLNGETGGDTTPPAAVTTLAVTSTAQTSAALSWTAVGDDGAVGTASYYDLRYSTAVITAGNWASASRASGEPVPHVAGTSETFTVTGLTAGTTYYFALKVGDEVPNWSTLSNVPNGTTPLAPDATPPAAITTLSLSSTTQTTATLAWTAVGDDGTTGTATTYDVRYSTANITAGNWGMATQVPGEPSPRAAGQAETFTVTGLTAGTTYYFAIKVADEVPNWSGLSNVPSGATLPAGDGTAPAAVTTLAVSLTSQTSVPLIWTAVGDDSCTGTATTYDIRYATAQITEANWGSASQVSGEPAPKAAGQAENFTVTGLSASTTYYFAIQVADEVPNWSELSNVPSGRTLAAGDGTPPAVVDDLGVTDAGDTWLALAWTAVGDDGHTGTARTYDLRRSTAYITAANWSSATRVTGEPSPGTAGTSETFTVDGLSDGTTYYFALKVADEVPNWSGLSDVASDTTLPSDSPSGITAAGWSDGNFVGADWAVLPVISATSAIDLIATQALGGNPEAFREIDLSLGAALQNSAIAIHLYQPVLWDLGVQGPIQSLDTGLDFRSLNGVPARVGLVIHQVATHGSYAWMPVEAAADLDWTSYGMAGLTAEDFVSITPGLAGHPDLGASTGLIMFGFLVGQRAVPSGGATTVQAGVDNWWVDVNPEGPTDGRQSTHPAITHVCLQGNYPNPFKPETRIVYDLPSAQRVTLRVFDSGGRLVKTLVSETMPAGQHACVWQAEDDHGRRVPCGIYVYQLQAGEHLETRTACLID